MKLSQFLFIFLVFNLKTFSQVSIPNFVYEYAGDGLYYIGHNNQLYEFDSYSSQYRNITNLCYIDNNGYLRVNYKISTTSYMPIAKEEQYYVILSPRQLFEFFSEDIINRRKDMSLDDPFSAASTEDIFIQNISSNVFLKENNLEYSAQNLLRKFFFTDREFRYEYWSQTLPLAIGSEQMNIFEMNIQFKSDVEGIFLLNGFVDFYRPHLYKDNRRIREIKIMDKQNQFERNYILEDKIEFQEILFPKSSDAISIKILSYYEGNKYTDICCSAILPIFNETLLGQRLKRLISLNYDVLVHEMFSNSLEIE
jgi:hypothetical protein